MRSNLARRVISSPELRRLPRQHEVTRRCWCGVFHNGQPPNERFHELLARLVAEGRDNS